MHKKGWNIEVLAWERTCNPRLKEWAKKIGIFIALEDFYESVMFTDDDHGVIRRVKPIDLQKRPVSKS